MAHSAINQHQPASLQRHSIIYFFLSLSRSLHTGDILENAVLLSVQLQDEAAFERNFSQLNVYYTDARSATGLWVVAFVLLAPWPSSLLQICLEP